MKGLLSILFLLFTISSNGQESGRPGSIEIVQDASVDRLLHKHIEINKLNPGIEGFRVQIFFDSGNQSKSRAFEAYSGFMSNYPGKGAYISFQEPNFKVRVGNFRSRIEAEGFMKSMLHDYPSALVVRDNIEYPALP